jgi:hypothetical protein
MRGRDRASASEEAIRKPAQSEHFERPSMDCQSARLSDSLAAPFDHGDLHLCQSEFASKPQADRSGTDHQNVELINHHVSDQHL